MALMSTTEDLHQRLRLLDAEFDREMRARGFDPGQQENLALPAHLAELYKQREQIKSELDDLLGEEIDD